MSLEAPVPRQAARTFKLGPALPYDVLKWRLNVAFADSPGKTSAIEFQHASIWRKTAKAAGCRAPRRDVKERSERGPERRLGPAEAPHPAQPVSTTSMTSKTPSTTTSGSLLNNQFC